MSHVLMAVLATAAALILAAALGLTRFGRSDRWLATVTPLASIIGSGFLICGPLLAREFGSLAAPAMAALLLLAFAIGSVVRFNIRHAEPLLEDGDANGRLLWLGRAGQAMLAIAYAISVAYYLKLLAAFTLRAVGSSSELTGNLIVTAIIVVLMALSFTGGLRRVEHVAHASVSVKIGLIGGMLVALAADWIARAGHIAALPPAKLSWDSVPMLLGLIVTVQGFETSRYLGEDYETDLRVKTMRDAQLLSSAIYLLFLVLLTPRLGQAANTQGVAGVLDVMRDVAPFLGVFVLAAAVTSQLSAAVADSIGSTGLTVELTARRLGQRGAFLVAGGLAILVTWLTNPESVIALASRAFAAFYAVQCVTAIAAARETGTAAWWRVTFFGLIGIACAAAVVAGAPAGG